MKNLLRIPALGLLAAVVTLSLLLTAQAASAATGYGELLRFGLVNSEREKETETEHLSEARTLSIGVDPGEKNSVYVLEERKHEEISASETEETRFFRLKKFMLSGTTYKETAHTDFQETSPHLIYRGIVEQEEYALYHTPEWEKDGWVYIPRGPENEKAGASNIVVNSKTGHVYFLVSDLRKENAGIDRWSHEGIEQWQLPPREGHAVSAASSLYAFNTKEEAGKLVPAKEANAETGVLAGPTTLEPQSEAAGKALLEPHGIALDQATNEIIVLAHEDSKGNLFDNISTATDHTVLQKIAATGTLGARYVDSENKLKAASSPVVVPGPKGQASEEQVLVEAAAPSSEFGYALFKVPENFSATEKPAVLAASEPLAGGIENAQVYAGLSQYDRPFGDIRAAHVAEDGMLSVSPEGVLFGTARIGRPIYGHTAAIGAYSGATGETIGWTGGSRSAGEGTTKNHCVLEPLGEEQVSQVAAGSGGDVFELTPEFLAQREEEESEATLYNPEFEEDEEEIPTNKPTFPPAEHKVGGVPGIVEFGPAGTGCEEASVEPLVAQIAGKTVTKAPANTLVRLSANVNGADANKVEWTFEPESGAAEKQTTTQAELHGVAEEEPEPYHSPGVSHAFDKLGKWKVTAKIYTDDLAAKSQTEYAEGVGFTSPSFTETTEVTIEPGPPNAQFVGPTTAKPGQTVTFESKSTDPNGAEMEYTWSFGDGSTSEPTKEKTITHVYTAAATYTVVLHVKDTAGQSATSANHTIVVAEPKSEGETGGGGGTQTQIQTPPIEPAKGGTGEVLSYKIAVPGKLSVSSKGAVSVKVSCSGKSSCAGTVVLKTLTAVVSGTGKHKKKAILTLATGSFSIAGGASKTVTLHLSAAARGLLAKAHGHTLRVHAVIAAKDSSGAKHTNTSTVTLALAKKK